MTRGIWTKWIIGAAIGLLIVATGCILYYQQTTQADKQAAEQVDKLLQKWEADKAKPTTTVEKEVNNTSAESITPTAEKPTNKIGEGTETNTDKATEPVNIATSKQDDPEEVEVSPHGFGPYPEVPEDYIINPFSWDSYKNDPPIFELMARVRIKLWKQGYQVEGIGEEGGLLYPIIRGIVYIRRSPSGKYITGKMGHPRDNVSIEQIESGAIPAGITVLDADEMGIDPYKFLNLQRVPDN